jgi:acetyl/propionyl-CoA carboxylase alpha subunit
MRYLVDVAGERVEVVLEGEEAVVAGERVSVHLSDVAGTPVRLVTIGTTQHRVVARRGDARGRYALSLDGWRLEVDALDERTRAIRDLSAQHAGPAGPTPIIAPMPGLIVRVAVRVGERVAAGQGLVVMEAMKMENELRAAADAVVRSVHAMPGKAVEKGTLLVEFDPVA